MTSVEQTTQLMHEIQALKAELSLFRERCDQYSQAYDALKEQIKEMQRHRFGKRSERYIDPEQPQLDLFQDNTLLFSNAEAAGEQLPEDCFSGSGSYTEKEKIKFKRVTSSH